jgi:uncharacterized phosphosugar-binding protein
MTEDAMAPVDDYFRTLRQVLDRIESTQGERIEDASRVCATAIAAGGVVHVFGSGHSRIVVEELWPRYGSYPGFHPIVELSLTSYHQVAGANGQRQAMFLENVPGLAAQILRNFNVGPDDALIAVSSGGTSVVTVEVAELLKARGLPVVAITSLEHSSRSVAKAPSGQRLFEVADVVLDTCTPVGDAAVTLPGMAAPVGPTTTVAGAAIANAVKVRVAEMLLGKGIVPKALPSPLLVGVEASSAAFEAAYDEHARRIAPLYQFPEDER